MIVVLMPGWSRILRLSPYGGRDFLPHAIIGEVWKACDTKLDRKTLVMADELKLSNWE